MPGFWIQRIPIAIPAIPPLQNCSKSQSSLQISAPFKIDGRVDGLGAGTSRRFDELLLTSSGAGFKRYLRFSIVGKYSSSAEDAPHDQHRI